MTQPAEKIAPAKSRSTTWILFGLVGILAAGAGVAVPVFLLNGFQSNGQSASHGHPAKDDKLVVIPFDTVSVNLSTERLTRYVRVKIVLVVEEAKKVEIGELVKKKQSFLKNWLISYLADQTIEDIKGTAGVNRVRREVQNQFNALLYPDGPEEIHDILFEEFLIQ